MTATIQELERLLRLFEGEEFANNWVNLMLLIELVHLLEAVLGSINNTLDSNVAAQNQYIQIRPVIRLINLARDVTNAVDQPAKGNTTQALVESFGSADFEDDISAVVVCYTHDFFLPVGCFAVVDCVVCAEFLGLF